MTTAERLRTNKVEFKLSILIITLSSRREVIKGLLDVLSHQCAQKPVQVLWLGDNRSLITGDKRNAIMSLANGRYLTFIDDDDMISDDYVDSILEAIGNDPANGPEVITYLVDKQRNGQHEKFQRFNKEYGMNYTVRAAKRRYQNMLPNHLCVWRKDIVREAFPPNTKSEDLKWAARQEPHYTKEGQHHIDKVLYFYRFDTSKTETQHRR